MEKLIVAAALALVVIVTPASAQDWSGAYAGLGVATGRIDVAGQATSKDELFTGLAGYNLSLGDGLIVGGEFDVTDDNFESNGYLSSLRGRIGMEMLDGQGLAFVSAGYMAMRVQGETGDGLALSAGYEHVLTDALRLRAEYVHGELELLGVDLNVDEGRAALVYDF